jgi:hypothetical protein
MKKQNTARGCLIALFFLLPWAGKNLVAEVPHVGQFIEFMHNNVKREYLLHVPQSTSEEFASGIRAS